VAFMSGSVELPRQQTIVSVALVVEAARRVELAARSLNSNRGRFIDELRRRAMRWLPERNIGGTTKTIIETVKAWIRAPKMSAEPGYQPRSTAFEYDR
jgi:hypothetical protein